MGPYLGNYAEDTTIDFIWDTNSGVGGSITRDTNGTISVYKGNSTTQTVVGVTDTEDFDGVTGIHHVRIVTTDAFYVVGEDYNVVLSGAIIDGSSVNANLATFSIENRFNAVDEFSDEPLTGATHNVVNSGGRRLRQLQEAGGYSGGAIYIDTVNGVAGTTNFENGVETSPVSNIADANTLAASLGIARFVVLPGSTITLAATQSNQSFEGIGWTLALGSQSIVGSRFIGATVSGVASGTGTSQFFNGCTMNAVTHIANTHIIECGMAGTQTVGAAGDYFLDRCHSAIAGTGTWVFEFGDAIGNTNLNVRNWSGGIQLESMGDTGTDTASIEGQGQVVEGTCVGGTVAIRGNFTVSGITNLTLSDDARIDTAQINAEVDTALAAVVGTLADAAAIGDPTSADTVMQYVKQLINVLVGTAGIGTFPASAAPANGINLAEVLRAVYDDSNELQGDWVNTGRLDTILDNIEVDTGTSIPALLPAALVGGKMDSDTIAISGSTTAADRLEESVLSIESGAAETGTLSTTQMTSNLTEVTDDHYIGRIIIWTSGVLLRQATDITDYAGTNGLLTFTAVTEAPSNTDTFIIV